MFKKCLFLLAISVSFSCIASQFGYKSPYQRPAATAAAALQQYELSLAAQVERSIPKKPGGAQKRKTDLKASLNNDSSRLESMSEGSSAASSGASTPTQKVIPLPIPEGFTQEGAKEVPIFHQTVGSLADVVPHVGAEHFDRRDIVAFSDLDRVVFSAKSTDPRHYDWWAVVSPTASPQGSPAKREKRIARAIARAPFLEEGPQTQSTFERIKQKVGAIFGLTARPASSYEITFASTKKVGIEFSSLPELGEGPVFLYQGVDPETGQDSSIVYYKGILLCGYSPKPRAVVELYKRLRLVNQRYPLPKKISFFDDQEYNIGDFMDFASQGLSENVDLSTRTAAIDLLGNLKALSLFHFAPHTSAHQTESSAAVQGPEIVKGLPGRSSHV